MGFLVKYTTKLKLLHNVEAYMFRGVCHKKLHYISALWVLGDLLKFVVQSSVSWSLLVVGTLFLLVDSAVGILPVKCVFLLRIP